MDNYTVPMVVPDAKPLDTDGHTFEWADEPRDNRATPLEPLNWWVNQCALGVFYESIRAMSGDYPMEDAPTVIESDPWVC
jgi:hypothetical protein